MVLFTKVREIEKVETLIDTGASSNFIRRTLLDLLKPGEAVAVQPCNITLKLADNNTTVTSGIIWLPVTIGDHQMRVQMYVLEDSSYPLILGCEFLDKHAATLRFHAGRRDLQLPILSSEVKQLLNPVLSLIDHYKYPHSVVVSPNVVSASHLISQVLTFSSLIPNYLF